MFLGVAFRDPVPGKDHTFSDVAEVIEITRDPGSEHDPVVTDHADHPRFLRLGGAPAALESRNALFLARRAERVKPESNKGHAPFFGIERGSPRSEARWFLEFVRASG